MIRSNVPHNAESLTLTNKIEIDLMTCEKKILRKMCGPTYENGYWRIKMNQDIYDKFQSPGTGITMQVR
jgi:hypothetical protein